MDESNGIERAADVRSVHLKTLQAEFKDTKEQTHRWYELKAQIDSIVAQNYLEEINK